MAEQASSSSRWIQRSVLAWDVLDCRIAMTCRSFLKPRHPLNDRSHRFLKVSSVYATTSRPDLAILETMPATYLDPQAYR